jgi:hypothetical protein
MGGNVKVAKRFQKAIAGRTVCCLGGLSFKSPFVLRNAVDECRLGVKFMSHVARLYKAGALGLSSPMVAYSGR